MQHLRLNIPIDNPIQIMPALNMVVREKGSIDDSLLISPPFSINNYSFKSNIEFYWIKVIFKFLK